MEPASDDSLETTIIGLTSAALAASRRLALAPREQKDAALNRLAELIEASREQLEAANQQDLEAGREAGLSQPLLDRLTFTPARVEAMVDGLRQVAALPDPVGAVLDTVSRPNGLVIRKVRVPIGVVGIIYESRPNVTVDCAALCLKSGNAAVLRGGKEAFHSNTFLAELIQQALAETDLPEAAVQLIPTTDRAALNVLLKLDQFIHCLIPRGGEALIDFVAEHSRIPVIKHYKGVCSLYLDREADLDMAEAIVLNAKTQRVSVCNAVENLYVHKGIARDALGRIGKKLSEAGVELRCLPSAARIFDQVNHAAILLADEELEYEFAREGELSEEYLDYKLTVKVVESAEEAIADINRFGSGHSDGIITANVETAELFLNSVDAATVYWNASTRFTDGYAFGLGAEIGISTDRLHARGPMGLNELCTYKYQITGTGQIRE
ncbi:MAG: glutamate-5-semialdehyde dehydrogenase [Opitutales bacterium]